MIQTVLAQWLSVEEYAFLIHFQKDNLKRGLMKQLAFGALYGGRPDARILLPMELLPDIKAEEL